MNNSNKDTTDRIGYYFRNEKGILFIVVITGILYNAGIVAGPLMTKIISDVDACVEGMRKFTTEYLTQES